MSEEQYVTRKEIGKITERVNRHINEVMELLDKLSVATTGYRIDKLQLDKLIEERNKYE